jgi:hypothetical protein
MKSNTEKEVPPNNEGKQPDHPYEIGRRYLIRSRLYEHTGRLLAVYDHELVLEAVGDMQQIIVGRRSIIDASKLTG